MSITKYAKVVLGCGVLLFAGAIALEQFSQPAHAAGFTVCGDGSCPFSTVQSALDATPEGGVVTVAPGLYIETVLVTKPVTVRGAGPDTVVTGQSNKAAFTVTAPNVTLDSLTVGPYLGLGVWLGVIAHDALNLMLTNTTYQNVWTAVDAERTDGLFISGNSFTNAVQAIDVRESSGLRVGPNRFTDITAGALHLTDDSDVRADSLTFTRVGQALIATRLAGVTMSHLAGSVTSSAFSFDAVHGITVDDAQLSGSGAGDGVIITSVNGPSDGLAFSRSTLTGFVYGVRVAGAALSDVMTLTDVGLEGNSTEVAATDSATVNRVTSAARARTVGTALTGASPAVLPSTTGLDTRHLIELSLGLGFFFAALGVSLLDRVTRGTRAKRKK